MRAVPLFSLVVDRYRSCVRVFTREPTEMTRFWVAAHTLLLGLSLSYGRPGALSVLRQGDRYLYLPLNVWLAVSYTLAAVMLWRTFGHRPRPLVSWVGNTLMALLWGSIVIGRVVADGPTALANGSTATWLMAVWVLLRTEATFRDSESA